MSQSHARPENWIGKTVSEFSYRLTREKIQEYLRAIGEDDTIFTDIEAARAEGLPDTPAPPAVLTVVMFWGNPDFYSDMEQIGVNKDRFLHYRERYDMFHPIYPDTTFNVTMRIEDVRTRKSMQIVVAAMDFADQSGTDYATVTSTIMVRPESS